VLLRRFSGAEGAADWELAASAAEGDVSRATGFGGAGEEAPCFAVFFEEAVAASVGVEAEAFARSGGLDGDDVPDIERDDVGGDEVDLVRGRRRRLRF